MVWYLSLAMIGSLSGAAQASPRVAPKARRAKAPLYSESETLPPSASVPIGPGIR